MEFTFYPSKKLMFIKQLHNVPKFYEMIKQDLRIPKIERFDNGIN